jgi:Tol biopolymer transport system component
MDRDGTHRHRLGGGEVSWGPDSWLTYAFKGHDHRPDWSPDGTKLAFARLYRQPDGGGLLYGSIHVVRRDGTHLQRLTY